MYIGAVMGAVVDAGVACDCGRMVGMVKGEVVGVA